MTRPAEAALLVAHVIAAFVSYGALVATGAYARLVRRSRDPYRTRALLTFFRPGHNLAARAIVLVPLLGAALVATGGHATSSKAYPWIGLALWFVAGGLASFVVWPAEAAVQRLLREEPVGRDRTSLDRTCRRLELAAGAIAALFLVSLGIMVAQP